MTDEATRTARSIRPVKRICRRPLTSPHFNRVNSTAHAQGGDAPACSPLGDDCGGLMSVFWSRFTGTVALGGDPIPVLLSQFTGAPAPVHSGDPMSVLSSEFIEAAGPIHDGDLKSVFSSQSKGAPAPADDESVFTGQLTVAPAPADDESMFTDHQFMGAPATMHDGDPMYVFSSQLPVGDLIPVFTSQVTGPALPAHGDDPMPMFPSQLLGAAAPMHGGYPMPAFPSQPMELASGDPMSMFSSQSTGAPAPTYGGDLVSVLPSQFMGAAAPVYGGVFSSQLTGAAGGDPLSMLSSHLTAAASSVPAPVYSDDPMFVFWSPGKRAPAPAHGGDTMSMFSRQLNGAWAPALNPWTTEDLLFEQVPTAYPNDGTRNQRRAIAAMLPPGSAVETEQRHSNQQEDIGKILDGKVQSPGSWDDGIVNNSRNQNDDCDHSIVTILKNVSSLPPPTNLLRGRQPRARLQKPRQTAAKKAKRSSNVAWTEDEQRLFLRGLNECSSGDWKRISREYLKTKTPTQVASHAQKYFLRLKDREEGRLTGKRKSIHDITLD